jgi:hypothetical protein
MSSVFINFLWLVLFTYLGIMHSMVQGSGFWVLGFFNAGSLNFLTLNLI